VPKYPIYKNIGLERGFNLEKQQYYENCAIYRSKSQSESRTSGLEWVKKYNGIPD